MFDYRDFAYGYIRDGFWSDSTGRVSVYLTFGGPMNTEGDIPADVVKCVFDGVEYTSESTYWLDDYTIVFEFNDEIPTPTHVSVAYDGSSRYFRYKTGKQIVNWGTTPIRKVT